MLPGRVSDESVLGLCAGLGRQFTLLGRAADLYSRVEIRGFITLRWSLPVYTLGRAADLYSRVEDAVGGPLRG